MRDFIQLKLQSSIKVSQSFFADTSAKCQMKKTKTFDLSILINIKIGK